MYNPATQLVQVLTGVNLGSYYLKTKTVVGVSPTAFLSKKKQKHGWGKVATMLLPNSDGGG
jgi:hypothetical protein